MPKRKTKPQSAANFKIGDLVRVKRGIADTDYPDIPLGGWAGEIVEVHKEGLCTIQWSNETLASMPLIYRMRCEKDDAEIERYWLAMDELIPDAGGPVEMEHPANIVTKPLNLKDEDDRVRMVFQLTSDDPLPEVDFTTLEVYRGYLSDHLEFPIEAVWDRQSGPFSSTRQQIHMTGMGDPDEDFRIDESYGLICEIKIDKQRGDAPLAELQVKKADRNRQMVADYSSWFVNN